MKMNKGLCLIVALTLICVCGWTGADAEVTSHNPIRINSNSDFDASHGVTGGNGSASNPWIIEQFDINGADSGYCLYIGNTTDYFIVKYCYFHHASGNPGTYYWNSGLILNNVTNGKVMDCSVYSNTGHGGILLKDSDENAIEHVSGYSNVRGLYLYYSDNNVITYNNFSSNSLHGIFIS